MAAFTGQLWITSAVCNADVKKALSLSYSLRRTYTNRRIAVVASYNLTDHLKRALAIGFDLVFYIEEFLNTACMKLDDFAKLYAIHVLRSFDKCVFVSPSILAVKNCDDIFVTEGVTDNGLLLIENDKDASVFLFKPSINYFKSIMLGLGCNMKAGNRFGTYLANWSKNQFDKSDSLDQKYNCVLAQGKVLFGFEQDVCFVNLENCADNIDMESLRTIGILGELIGLHWQNILEEDVLPLIEEGTDTVHALENLPMDCKESIAIVGMSCRYPGSNNLQEFWDLLFQGQDGTCKPPPFRWMREQCINNLPDAKNTNAGFLKVPVDEFDAKFFGVSPKEAVFLDPQHRLMHELIWEGLEDACIDPQTLRGTSGSVFFGSWINNYKEILQHSGNYEFYRTYMGNSIGAAAARMSFLLGLTGPSISTESGCSSAMVALHLACRSLQFNETNLALVGGVNLLLHPFDNEIMPMVLSPDGHCKTFSSNADGFARAEGCGVLVLKRLSTALKDGDNIWALIRGSAVSQEGISKSLGTPTVHCESLAMKDALNDARVHPGEVSYVEAHGTGTSVGDPMEIAAISKAYNCSSREKPLIIGSVKTNVGHTESCSGITGIMKVVLSMFHETIPAHLNFTKLNPAINLEAVPAIIPLERMEWKKCAGKPRIAGVNAFGITGTDAHVLIQEPPETSAGKIMGVRSNFERPLHILKITAKTKEALELLLTNYKGRMETSQDNLCDIAYSANTGRANFNHRIVLISKDKNDAILKIDKQNYIMGDISNENNGKICFLFTGQGSQYQGMAKHLHESSPIFQMHFDYCENIMKKNYNISLKDVLWGNEVLSQDKINQTIYSQTSIFCVQYALFKLWESWGVKPDFALGHSLGEFAASVCAGIISVDDAIKLVAERSKLIDELPHGKMLVMKASFNQVETLMGTFAGEDPKRVLDYAAINSSTQTVVAGDSDTVMDFRNFCMEKNIKCVDLSASHAFHSRHMDAILEKYGVIANTVNAEKSKSSCQYISGLKGGFVCGSEVNAEYWIQHTRERVNFLDASKNVVALGCRVFIEIGPQPVLSSLTMMNNDVDLLCLPSLKRKENSWDTILTSLGKLYANGTDIDWKGIDQFYNRKKVQLPHYPFIGKKCWPDMMQTTGRTIHDLIGSPIPNASSTKIFQNGINLRSHEYIKDHAIGQQVVFPGAGYVEMCLAAGLATVENSTDSVLVPTRPMKIENLLIKAPLALSEDKTCQLQTVVETSSNENNDEWSDLFVRIFHRVEVDTYTKWMEHASASFVISPAAEELIPVFDIEQFMETIEKPSNKDEMIMEAYEKLDSVGLKFGPLFRSLEKLWEQQNSTILAKLKTPEGGNSKEYILHPVMIDAMIQAIMIFGVSSHEKAKLYVPLKIGNFIWLANNLDNSGEMYIQVFDPLIHLQEKNIKPTTTMHITAYLINGKGNVLAMMSAVEFIDTTSKTLEVVLEQQISPMPDMWEENWRQKLGPSQHRHDMELISKETCFDDNFIENVREKFNEVTSETNRTLHNMDRLVYLNYLRCLYELGWNPEPDSVFSEDQLFTQLNIKPEFIRFLRYMLSVLEVDGVLKNVGLFEWKVMNIPESLSKIKERICIELKHINLKSIWLLMKLGEEYSEILKGTRSALPILFPDDSNTNRNWPSVAEFYLDYGKFLQIFDILRDVGTKGIGHLKAKSKSEKNVLRILEVGAGTGMSAKPFTEILEAFKMQYEYTFTDISAGFFPAAEKLFESQSKKMIFKKLNIENDPVSQGFVPYYYDYVIAGDVIHATKNIVESLTNIKMLLRTGGQLVVIEQTKVSRFLTSIFGLLNGFWRFEDVEMRPNHCIMSIDKWREVLEKTGFTNINVFSTCDDSHSVFYAHKNDNCMDMLTNGCTYGTEGTTNNCWIIFYQDDSLVCKYLRQRLALLNDRNVITVQAGKEFKMSKLGNDWDATIDLDSKEAFFSLFQFFECIGGNVVLEGVLYCWSLDKESTVQENVLRPFFYMVQAVLSMKKQTFLKVMALMNGVLPLEDNVSDHFFPSTLIGFVKSLQNERTNFICRCIDLGGKEDELGAEQVFYEIWNTDKESQVCFQDTNRYVVKIQPTKSTLTDLKLPSGSNRFQLILPDTKSISDLQFGLLGNFPLVEGEMEVHVKASALNFKDVLNVLKPSDDFKFTNSVGFDFAGIVKRIGPGVSKYQIGQQVFGLNINGDALPSHVKMDENDVLPVPEGMTLWDACTLPAVVATSYHCLLEVAKITAADTILIHAASGGVGLSAISICKRIGCTIIVTAGSKRKRNYLRSLGIEHVYHSRNTEFSEKILRATKGRGVDVILNSLTSEGFKEATLKACGIGARFVEIGKLMIWKPEEVKLLRPDVTYTIVDLSSMKKSDFQRIFLSVAELIANQYVKPIPYVRFDAVNIREALNYLQKAKHIGKVVCVMPQIVQSNGTTEMFTPMFNENSTYLITGGLGGIGYVVCKWMIKKGAKYIILAGRSAPSEPMQNSIREINEQFRSSVHAVQLDVGDFQQCKELIQEKIPTLMGSLRPLRGVMHAAGTLQDNLIEDHTWSTLSSTFDSKVNGTLNLHELTKNMNLEHFVLFSSLASFLGPLGQCNHSAGNKFEDVLAHYRISIGLPATSINWGQWGEAGIAREMILPGIKPLSNLQGTKGLEYALKAHRAQIGFINIESYVMLSKVYPQVTSLFDDRTWKSLGNGVGSGISYHLKSGEFWQQYDSLQNIEEKNNLLLDKLRHILIIVLKLDETDIIESKVNFEVMGVDSLMFVEIKNAIQTLFGNRVVVNPNLMRDLHTLEQLAEALVQLIEGENMKENVALKRENSSDQEVATR